MTVEIARVTPITFILHEKRWSTLHQPDRTDETEENAFALGIQINVETNECKCVPIPG